MKGRSAILDTLAGRKIAALLVDGQLDDLLIDGLADAPPSPGTVFRALVDRPAKGLGGVFVRLPDGGKGFVKQAGGLSGGQSVIVQVTGFAEPGKAIPLTMRVLFKSKYGIVTPGALGRNISRQVRDPDRRQALEDLAMHAPLAEGHGLILRSDAAITDDDDIREDLAKTCELATAVMSDATGGPERLLDGPDAHETAWRDWGHPDEVDSAPGSLAARGVLDEIAALNAHVPLETGSFFVEPTRACVAIDVNTGMGLSPSAGETANLAVARALPRALRLRGLGGAIVVDPAPMPKKNRRHMEQVAKAAFRQDPVETTVVGWTPLGHLELQRKRERRPMSEDVLKALL